MVAQDGILKDNAHGAANVRVFGSMARGNAGPESDIDSLVDIETDHRDLEFCGRLKDLRRALEALLGHPVDVGEATQEHAQTSIEQDALPL